MFAGPFFWLYTSGSFSFLTGTSMVIKSSASVTSCPSNTDSACLFISVTSASPSPLRAAGLYRWLKWVKISFFALHRLAKPDAILGVLWPCSRAFSSWVSSNVASCISTSASQQSFAASSPTDPEQSPKMQIFLPGMGFSKTSEGEIVTPFSRTIEVPFFSFPYRGPGWTPGKGKSP